MQRQRQQHQHQHRPPPHHYHSHDHTYVKVSAGYSVDLSVWVVCLPYSYVFACLYLLYTAQRGRQVVLLQGPTEVHNQLLNTVIVHHLTSLAKCMTTSTGQGRQRFMGSSSNCKIPAFRVQDLWVALTYMAEGATKGFQYGRCGTTVTIPINPLTQPAGKKTLSADPQRFVIVGIRRV